MTSPKSKSLDDLLSSQLAQRKTRNLFRSLETPANEQGLVDFSSNDYLSLSRNADVRQEYVSLIQQRSAARGTQLPEGDGFGLGSGGSRLLDGNSALAEGLERALARFHGAPAGLLFNSGYEANTGLFSAVPQVGDVVVYDEFIHASVHSGMRLSRARRTVKFRHNTVWRRREEEEDLLEGRTIHSARSASSAALRDVPLLSLDETLRQFVEDRDGREIREGRKHVFIAVEALYSMDGDLAPLEDIVKCVEQHLPLGNGHVIVDEAHSNGIFGPGGRGLVCELGLEKRIWATVMTFGKAMGCSGGKLVDFFISTRETLRLHDGLSQGIESRMLTQGITPRSSQNSNRPLHTHHAFVSHQLRPLLHLHHSHGLPLACQHSSRPQLRRQWPGGRGPTQALRPGSVHAHATHGARCQSGNNRALVLSVPVITDPSRLHLQGT